MAAFVKQNILRLDVVVKNTDFVHGGQLEIVQDAIDSGAIVNVASTAGVSPRPRLSWYNASKGWMITATKTMAVELAPEGIRVNAVRPGVIYTEIHAAGGEPERVERVKSSVPMGRGGQPEEVAAAVLWLASDDAGFITGVSIPVDGGYLVHNI